MNRNPVMTGVAASNRERAAAARRERELRARTTQPTPALDDARAEFHTTRPTLVVETLAQRLERLVPGAHARYYWLAAVEERWRVRLGGRVIGKGSTEREAVDRAIALRGVR